MANRDGQRLAVLEHVSAPKRLYAGNPFDGGPDITLVELWQRSTERNGSRELFGTKKAGGWHWISYAEFKLEVDALRAGLSALGIAAGDRVALIAGNRVEWAAACYATFGLGATFVPMYEAQPPEDWAFILKDCEARAVIGASELVLEKLASVRGQLPNLVHLIGLDLQRASPHRSFSLAKNARNEGMCVRGLIEQCVEAWPFDVVKGGVRKLT